MELFDRHGEHLLMENLPQIIDSTKAWRDAWSSILNYQYRLLNEFETLYAPIIGSSDPAARNQPIPTPHATLARTSQLREEYEDLRKDLLIEVGAVDERMIRPAMQAKDYLQPIKKTMKKREDKKVRHRPVDSIFLGLLTGHRFHSSWTSNSTKAGLITAGKKPSVPTETKQR
jgi:hypothetical protein